jgi:hypothetical protein
MNRLGWILLIISIALNVITIGLFLYARQVTVDALYNTKSIVDGAADDTLNYDYPISQTMPVRVVVPIREDVSVPISTVVPINTSVEVEVDTGVFGKVPLTIPIDARFPISVTLPVHVEKDVNINTSIPVSVTVPIVVPIADTPLHGYLVQVSDALDRAGRSLGGPGQKP